jgi:hypothetical protein
MTTAWSAGKSAAAENTSQSARAKWCLRHVIVELRESPCVDGRTPGKARGGGAVIARRNLPAVGVEGARFVVAGRRNHAGPGVCVGTSFTRCVGGPVVGDVAPATPSEKAAQPYAQPNKTAPRHIRSVRHELHEDKCGPLTIAGVLEGQAYGGGASSCRAPAQVDDLDVFTRPGQDSLATVRDRIRGYRELVCTGLLFVAAACGGRVPEVETQVGPDPADANTQTCLIPEATKNNGCVMKAGNCVPRGFDMSSPSVCIPTGNDGCDPAPGLGFLLDCGDMGPDPSLNCDQVPQPGFAPAWCCVCGQ